MSLSVSTELVLDDLRLLNASFCIFEQVGCFDVTKSENDVFSLNKVLLLFILKAGKNNTK
jgi:hypothetical protein